MPYVLGKMTATLHADGRREVAISDLEIKEGDKPRTLEASGSDARVWKDLRADKPGTYQTLAHFGGATALLVPTAAIALPDEHFLGPMVAQSGQLGPEALLGAVRTGASAATQHCVDTCGGMWTGLDRMDQALSAMLKILPFRHNGWVRVVLPNELASHQAAFENAQQERWAVAREGFSPAHEAQLEFARIGRDSFEGEATLVVFGPIGDCQLIRIARLKLEGDGFLFRDGEWKWVDGAFGSDLSGRYVPLNRKIVVTTTVADHPGVPLILELHPDGHLHQGGLHVFVEESPLSRRLLSHNPARVLGPHGLDWLA